MRWPFCIAQPDWLSRRLTDNNTIYSVRPSDISKSVVGEISHIENIPISNVAGCSGPSLQAIPENKPCSARHGTGKTNRRDRKKRKGESKRSEEQTSSGITKKRSER
eukprot:m.170712 g.170712  ORF g.170712 m.170712 type:complete len:107 (+) comp39045_c0_seq14:264-584(+)